MKYGRVERHLRTLLGVVWATLDLKLNTLHSMHAPCYDDCTTFKNRAKHRQYLVWFQCFKYFARSLTVHTVQMKDLIVTKCLMPNPSDHKIWMSSHVKERNKITVEENYSQLEFCMRVVAGFGTQRYHNHLIVGSDDGRLAVSRSINCSVELLHILCKGAPSSWAGHLKEVNETSQPHCNNN